MFLRSVQFVAIVLMALALVPAGAHLFALPNKLAMAQAEYFAAQGAYRGWALFGVVLFGALAATAVLAVMERRQGLGFWLVLGAWASLAASLAIFFIRVFPTNQATLNWTTAPANWQALRVQWEYGHAASALVTFLGFCLLILSVLRARRPG